MTHSPLFELGISLAAIILTASAYEATYCNTVEPDVWGHALNKFEPLTLRYRMLPEAVWPVFSLAHSIDRKLRPEFWLEATSPIDPKRERLLEQALEDCKKRRRY
jgi:hypothetical protein